MKALSSHLIALAGVCVAAAMFAAEPPLRAANDNHPAPHHGGEHEPAPQSVGPARKGRPQAAGKR
jgi:hypothetical protein